MVIRDFSERSSNKKSLNLSTCFRAKLSFATQVLFCLCRACSYATQQPCSCWVSYCSGTDLHKSKEKRKKGTVTMWCGIYRIARDGHFKGNHSAKASCCMVPVAKAKSEFRLPLWQLSHNTCSFAFYSRFSGYHWRLWKCACLAQLIHVFRIWGGKGGGVETTAKKHTIICLQGKACFESLHSVNEVP